jgi:hypothetical protein
MLKNQTVELLPARTTMRQHKAAMPSITVNVLIFTHNLVVIEHSNAWLKFS